jgi:hypothetical protein
MQYSHRDYPHLQRCHSTLVISLHDSESHLARHDYDDRAACFRASLPRHGLRKMGKCGGVEGGRVSVFQVDGHLRMASSFTSTLLTCLLAISPAFVLLDFFNVDSCLCLSCWHFSYRILWQKKRKLNPYLVFILCALASDSRSFVCVRHNASILFPGERRG